ncbi:unnamed protein product [Protopolystoma xenopodis]|uniref:Uncharacterized protein n=1 Tax=Protopolystoma xenopodis TaxID=117903 RepID=A0A3S5FDJ7_9PLAT|nr:unnamed protein product [Protopolystoma xenopodis]
MPVRHDLDDLSTSCLPCSSIISFSINHHHGGIAISPDTRLLRRVLRVHLHHLFWLSILLLLLIGLLPTTLRADSPTTHLQLLPFFRSKVRLEDSSSPIEAATKLTVGQVGAGHDVRRTVQTRVKRAETKSSPAKGYLAVGLASQSSASAPAYSAAATTAAVVKVTETSVKQESDSALDSLERARNTAATGMAGIVGLRSSGGGSGSMIASRPGSVVDR